MQVVYYGQCPGLPSVSPKLICIEEPLEGHPILHDPGYKNDGLKG